MDVMDRDQTLEFLKSHVKTDELPVKIYYLEACHL